MSFLNTEICDFKLQAFHDGEFREVDKKELLKNHFSVIFFYPADFTFVCPTELKDLADNYKAFQERGVEVYSVSCDTHFVHKAWSDQSPSIKDIKFPMIGDPTGILGKHFNVYNEANGLTDRGTFLLDKDGKVVLFEVSAGGIGRDASELLRKIDAALFVEKHGDQGCPAKWRQGQKTLSQTINDVGKY